MKFDNIELEWLGQSGFLIKTKGKIIYIDPYQISASEKADIILITHSHYDHCSIADIQKISKAETTIVCPPDCQSKIAKVEKVDMQIIIPGDEINIKDVKIKVIPAYNINKQFHQKSDEFVGYVLQFGEIAVYHAGDTDLIPAMEKLTGFKNLVALLPVGGTYTMNVEEAVKAASLIKPAVVVPMHWGSVVGSRADAERFVELCKEEGIKAEVLEKV